MRGKIMKTIAASAAIVSALAFAAPTFAAGTLACSPDSGVAGTALSCTLTGADPNKNFSVADIYLASGCTGSTYSGSLTGDNMTDGSGNATFSIADGFASTTTFSMKINAVCTNDELYTVNAPTAPTIADMFASTDIEDAATTAVTQVGPYVLAVFGILLIVGIATALVKRSQRKILLEMGKTPGEIREMQRAEAAQRRKERIGRRRGKNDW